MRESESESERASERARERERGEHVAGEHVATGEHVAGVAEDLRDLRAFDREEAEGGVGV